MIADDFYGDRFRWFIGVVKDVGDDRSRVRVRIFGIHHTEDQTKVSDGDLPWAMVLYPTTGGQTSGGNASHGLVNGTWVMGFFADGEDCQQPVVVGVINGGMGSQNNSPPNTNTDPANPQNNVSNPAETFTGDSSTTSSQLSGNSNTTKVYNYFYEKITKEAAYTGDIKSIIAAITGNFQIESNCSPQAYNPNDKGMPSVGLAQWRADRGQKFLSFCGVTTSVGKGNLPPLEKQLDYVWHEFHTSEKKAYNTLLTATTIQDATAAIILYERDASYRKIGNTWTVDRSSPYYTKKLNAARQVLSSITYTGTSSNNGGREA